MNVSEIKEPDGKVWRFHEYADFWEFEQDCLNEELHITRGKWTEGDRRSSRKEKSDRQWDMNADWDASVKLMQSGWSEGTARAELLVADILSVRGRMCEEDVMEFDTSGAFCDPGLLVEGVPECMAHLEKVNAPGSGEVVDIGINLISSSGVDSHQLALRGAAHLALLTALEDMGYKCTMTAIFATGANHSEGGIGVAVEVADTDYSVDRDLMAYVIGHPAFMRRQMFGMVEQFPKHWRQCCGIPGSYGNCVDSEEYKKRFDIYSPAFHLDTCDFTSTEGAVKWVNRRIEEFGAKIEIAD